ncbi:MAG: alpha/beta hydrolase [Phycisphaerales bacterium]|nr:alpha/beta hydrolase [Phycisphaerales bacterium]
MISALGTGVLVMLVSLAQPAAQLLDGLPGVQRVEDVLIVDDVPYGDEHERQVMDVATPLAHEGLLPVVVIIHGGGWMQGDKATVRSFLPPTAGGGCLVVAPNYRLAPTDPAPAAIHDVKLILRWLDRHAEDLGIDRDRIALMGFSAGGHLAALAGATSDTGALDPPGPKGMDRARPSVECVVSIGGPMDLSAEIPAAAEGVVTAWAGPAQPDGKGPRALYSPVHWIDPGDPPVLLIHGEADTICPVGQVTIMQQACERAQVPCETTVIPGAPHMPPLATYAVPLMQFLDEHLDATIEAYVVKQAPAAE